MLFSEDGTTSADEADPTQNAPDAVEHESTTELGRSRLVDIKIRNHSVLKV